MDHTPPSPTSALTITFVVIVLLTVFVVAGIVLHVAALFSGFFFVWYWGNVRKAELSAFAPAVLGAVGGLLLAWGLAEAKTRYGGFGAACVLALILVAIYVDIVQWVPQFINASFMLYVTIGGIPAVAGQADFVGMIAAMLLSAALFGGTVYAVTQLQSARIRT